MTDGDRACTARRAFLRGGYFTRGGRRKLAQENATQGRLASTELSLDRRQCLGWLRITCLSCSNACPEGAIETVSNLEPAICQQACIRCGKCVAVCPVGAIGMALW